MKAIFIKNIELEYREVHDSNGPIFRESILPGYELAYSPYYTSQPMEQKTYERVQVYCPKRKQLNYFVQLDDRELFQDLIEVSKYTIQKKQRELLGKFIDEELPRAKRAAAARERHRIKDLPWWKRLFNSF